MKFFRAFVLDLMALAGFGSFVFGIHQVFPPAALIVGGLLVLGGALAAARKADRRHGPSVDK